MGVFRELPTLKCPSGQPGGSQLHAQQTSRANATCANASRSDANCPGYGCRGHGAHEPD